MIDPATGWFEICQYDDKRSVTVANIAEQEWFSRYPWPTQISFDRGSEFIGQDFKDMIKKDYGIKGKPITTRNPQANSVIERIHQVLANMVRTFELENKYLDKEDPWKSILGAVAFAMRSTIHTTTQSTHTQYAYSTHVATGISRGSTGPRTCRHTRGHTYLGGSYPRDERSNRSISARAHTQLRAPQPGPSHGRLPTASRRRHALTWAPPRLRARCEPSGACRPRSCRRPSAPRARPVVSKQ